MGKEIRCKILVDLTGGIRNSGTMEIKIPAMQYKTDIDLMYPCCSRKYEQQSVSIKTRKSNRMASVVFLFKGKNI